VTPPLSSATVSPWTSSEGTSGTITGQKKTEWSEPTPNSPSYHLLRHGLQPAGEDDLVRAGLESAVGVYSLWCEKADFTPQQRVRVTGSALFAEPTDFRIRASWEWHNHTHAVLERI
jgi:hypothetical protein